MIKEETVKVLLVSTNIEYYESKGYSIPREKNKWRKLTVPRGTQIEVYVKDLPKGSNIKLTKICDICGKEVPNQTFNTINKLREDGIDRCNDCGNKKAANTKSIPPKEKSLGFLNPEISKELLYEDPFTVFNYSNRILKWKCSRCGNVWETAVSSRTKGHGCPECNTKSKGEKSIKENLEKLGIYFEEEKTFKELIGVGGGKLRLDFYIPNKKVAIEFDGRQHYEPCDFFGGEESFQRLKENEKIKEEFCKKKGIRLIRIPYYDEKMIEVILLNIDIL